MRSSLLFLPFFLAACSASPAPVALTSAPQAPKAARSCADAAAAVAEFARGYALQGGESAADAKQKGGAASAVVDSRCTKDAWPAAVVTCYAAWTGKRTACHEQLPPDARARLEAEGRSIEALWAF
jgi:hypothetical protein